MDVPALLRAVLEKMRQARERFGAAAPGERRGLYDEFLAGAERLNTVFKAGGHSEQVRAAIKARLTAALAEAEEMQRQLEAPAGEAEKPGALPKLESERTQFEDALRQAIVRESPNVSWEEVAGLENAKKALREAIVLPVRFPEVFVGLRKPWRGILLYGPPGTGKTHLARACATQARSTFFAVSSADLVSKYVGESEKLIKTLFALAREQRPSIIFIDEIDSLAGARSENEHDASRRVKTEFMVQMQGVSDSADFGLLVLGATNLPWALDSAIRRRFEKRVYIALPDPAARLQLLRTAMAREQHALAPADFDELAARTAGFSGSDLAQLVKNACYEPLRKFQAAEHFRRVGQTPDGRPRYMACAPSEPGAERLDRARLRGDEVEKNPISLGDFVKALGSSKRTVAEQDLGSYEQWTREFGMEG